MRAMDIIKKVSIESEVNYATISKRLGKTRGYVNAIASRGSEPQIDTFVRMLEACNYGVYVIDNNEEIPTSALRVTYDEQ